MLTPLVLHPRAVERVWGGHRIAEAFGRPYPSDRPIGEAWEVYGELEVEEGPFRGQTLDALVARLGHDLLGTRGDPAGGFPILTKWLDCNDWLSIQVHPDDRLAQELTGLPQARGKTECWFIWEADGELLHGLAPGVDPQAWSQLQGEALVEGLHRVRPRAGDFYYTAAGSVHALGPGLLLYEIQQSSDITYRLYDWGRPRETHPVEAVRCVLEAQGPPAEVSASGIRSPFFVVERREGEGRLRQDGTTFALVTLLEGGQVGDTVATRGATVVVPATSGEILVKTSGSWLCTGLPEGI